MRKARRALRSTAAMREIKRLEHIRRRRRQVFGVLAGIGVALASAMGLAWVLLN